MEFVVFVLIPFELIIIVSILFARAMDEFLPKAILDATQVILSMVGSVIVAATVNAYFLIPVAFMAYLFIYVRKVYLKTAKNIKRLEGMGKCIKLKTKFRTKIPKFIC